MSLYSRLYRQVVLPLGQITTRRDLLTPWQQIERIQHLPQNQIAALQNEKLTRLVADAITHVPYYRQQYASLGIAPGDALTVADLPRLPILERTQMMDAAESFKRPDTRLVKNATSGSTGQNLHFFQDWPSRDYGRAAALEAWRWIGIQPGDRTASLWGAFFERKASQRLRKLLSDTFSRHLFLSSYQLDAETSAAYWRQLARFRPRALNTYPSAVMSWMHYLQQAGLGPVPGLESIVTSSEVLYDFQREAIQAFFGVPVYSRYGSREFSIIAHECEQRDGLHAFQSHLIIEVVGEDDQPVPDGEVGDLVITNLANFGFPFIRYRIGDRGAWHATDEPCACGLTFRRLASVEGRSFDRVWAPNGRILPGTFWTIVNRTVPGIREFQVKQHADQSVEILISTDQDWQAAYTDVLIARIREHGGEDWPVSIRPVDEIPRTKSGKLRFVISEYKPDGI